MHPSVESRSSFFASAARFDSHCVSHTLDDVAQANFFFYQKPRKPNVMGMALGSARLGFLMHSHRAIS